MATRCATSVQALVDFQPTNEELEAARMVLSKLDDKGKKAQMQSMTNFVKKGVAEGADATSILALRGDERLAYLAKYMSYQSTKSARKTESFKQATHKDCLLGWWVLWVVGLLGGCWWLLGCCCWLVVVGWLLGGCCWVVGGGWVVGLGGWVVGWLLVVGWLVAGLGCWLLGGWLFVAGWG